MLQFRVSGFQFQKTLPALELETKKPETRNS
jgi:hypothetical protein